jgi:RimJ/RimL family protein N-acetyltransferase
MISVPHPFTVAHAAAWIADYGVDSPLGPHDYFAVCVGESDALVGVGALRDIDREHLQCELSFWIGRPHWGQGLATRAAEMLVNRAFGEHALNRIVAYHMLRNPASGRVLERLGFRREGVLRQRVRKWGAFEDVAALAMLRTDAAANNR